MVSGLNAKQLIRIGIPSHLVSEAQACLRALADQPQGQWEKPKRLMARVASAPETMVADPVLGNLARRIVQDRADQQTAPQRLSYPAWGTDLDPQSHRQMAAACRLPMARAGALMPDAHVGYGLPIGGVLACENAVIPYGVGVDIACRMKLSITDLPVEPLEQNDPQQCSQLDRSLVRGTKFGAGGQWKKAYEHAVLDEDWSFAPVVRGLRDRAVRQLGTSGSGNHFVEWGILTLPNPDLGLEAGTYAALLSHSGSRGAGALVCQHYSRLARNRLPERYKNDSELRHLGWLEMDTHEGQEYWAAMNLMGRYASANHEVIHRNVTSLAGAEVLAGVENHHNFAWLEEHQGRPLYVHRKGATPAGPGALGVIPGNMADACFVVRGRGKPESLNSAAHGAGRRMSRTEAKRQFDWSHWRQHLAQRNVRLLAGGLDEVPGAYKDIHRVMADQRDLVEVVAIFQPKIVMMCGDGSPPED